MPCSCSAGLCSACACGKAGRLCTPACHGAGNAACMNTAEGVRVSKIPLAEVRKTLAQAGLDVIGNQPELRQRLVAHLVALAAASRPAAPAPVEAVGAAAGEGAAGGGGLSNAALVSQALACGDDYAALLSLGGEPVTAASPVAVQRRAFLRLSLRLHPDKNVGVAGAPAAFQALVLAFERIQQQQDGGDAGASSSRREEGGGRPRERIDPDAPRSNAGCSQTRLYCPRCRMDWPRKELGLEDAAYNFMMMGLKEYTCGRCMCVFGCMAATHECPHCRRPFEYGGPRDYHRTVTCGHAACGRPFGFFQHPVSARRMAEVRKELAAAAEARMRQSEARARREGRAAARAPAPAVAPVAQKAGKSGGEGRGGGSAAAAAAQLQQQEALFRLRLIDECPRCGASMATEEAAPEEEEEEDDEEGGAAPARAPSESHAEHLARCTDAAAHKRHAAAVAARAAAAAAAGSKAEAAEEAAALAQWEAGGCVVGRLWVLPPRALATLCRRAGLPEHGDKVALVRRYGDHCRAAAAAGARFLALADAAPSRAAPAVAPSTLVLAAAARSPTRQRRADVAAADQLDAHELPSNLHALEADQLAAVAAALGLPGETTDGKAALINTIERATHRGRIAEAGLLTGAGPGLLEEFGGAGGKRLRQPPTQRAKALKDGPRAGKPAVARRRAAAASDSDEEEDAACSTGASDSGSAHSDESDPDVVIVSHKAARK